MVQRLVHVRAPSRLHFGMLSFGAPSVRRFGGVGVMVEEPGIELQIRAAEEFQVTGGLAERIRRLAARWAEWRGMSGLPACAVRLITAPRLHIGLGVGTQLGLSIAAGLNAFHDVPPPPLWQLAKSVGRGLRSAVGTHGFVLGGLVAEPGKLPEETLSPLEQRVEIPADWRFVLVCRRDREGQHDDAEAQIFSELPPLARETTEQLSRELRESLLPAAASGQFDQFSESVYRFGYQAGLCFAHIQSGAYNGLQLQRLVHTIRSQGVKGVGQSSWGPTVYAICRDPQEAERLVRSLEELGVFAEADAWISAACNTGARITSAMEGSEAPKLVWPSAEQAPVGGQTPAVPPDARVN